MIANPTYHDAEHRRRSREQLLATILALLVVAAMAGAGMLGLPAALAWAEARYDGRIHPNVYALGTALGGLSPAEAADALRKGAGAATSSTAVFYDGEKQWAISWAEAGIGPDLAATVDAALAVGRTEQDALMQTVSWLQRHDVEPMLTINPEQARLALSEVGSRTAVAPTDAALRLEGGQVVAIPGRAGRTLNVDATLAALVAGVAAQGRNARVELVFQPTSPRVADASPLLPLAAELASRRLDLSAYDVLADERFSWTLDASTIVSWLRVEPLTEGGSPALRFDRDAIRATLAELAAGMGRGRGLRLDEAAAQVQAALEAEGGAVQLYLTHPAGTYMVQPGDAMDRIAIDHGVPPAVLVEANPGIDANTLAVGQALVIPSPDVLLPHMPVAHKRIVISLGRQRMQVYENGALLYDWPVSTGIASSPTFPGSFQVLEKVENAYASRWSLWMPNFLAIYQSGPGFYNGIHALPINANGVRLWAGLLGRPASFGCIILGVDEAATLFEWAEVGVPVIVER